MAKINSCNCVYIELLGWLFFPQNKVLNEQKNLTRNTERNNAADMLYRK